MDVTSTQSPLSVQLEVPKGLDVKCPCFLHRNAKVKSNADTFLKYLSAGAAVGAAVGSAVAATMGGYYAEDSATGARASAVGGALSGALVGAAGGGALGIFDIAAHNDYCRIVESLVDVPNNCYSSALSGQECRQPQSGSTGFRFGYHRITKSVFDKLGYIAAGAAVGAAFGAPIGAAVCAAGVATITSLLEGYSLHSTLTNTATNCSVIGAVGGSIIGGSMFAMFSELADFKHGSHSTTQTVANIESRSSFQSDQPDGLPDETTPLLLTSTETASYQESVCSITRIESKQAM